jgi:hypothetical protein
VLVGVDGAVRWPTGSWSSRQPATSPRPGPTEGRLTDSGYRNQDNYQRRIVLLVAARSAA